jgi:hypothetical protein
LVQRAGGLMPGFAAIMGAIFVMEEYRFEQLERMRADDDGMAQPYIKLEGIKEPRMLSWAEERALRNYVEDFGQGRRYVSI